MRIGALLFQEDVEWCESNTIAAWAEDVLGVLSTVGEGANSRMINKRL